VCSAPFGALRGWFSERKTSRFGADRLLATLPLFARKKPEGKKGFFISPELRFG